MVEDGLMAGIHCGVVKGSVVRCGVVESSVVSCSVVERDKGLSVFDRIGCFEACRVVMKSHVTCLLVQVSVQKLVS